MKKISLILSILFVANSVFAMEMNFDKTEKQENKRNSIEDLSAEVLLEILLLNNPKYEDILPVLKLFEKANKKMRSLVYSQAIKSKVQKLIDKELIGNG